METNAALMDVIRLEGPCEVDEMTISQLPVPQVREGWMRVRVEAFGVNESESHSRRASPTRISRIRGSLESRASASSMRLRPAVSSSPASRSPS